MRAAGPRFGSQHYVIARSTQASSASDGRGAWAACGTGGARHVCGAASHGQHRGEAHAWASASASGGCRGRGA